MKSEIFKAYLRGQKDTTDTLINTFEEFQKLNGANAIMIDDVFSIINLLKNSIEKDIDNS